MPQIVIIGDSHAAALQKAMSQALFKPTFPTAFIPARRPPYEPVVLDTSPTATPLLNPAVTNELDRLLNQNPDTHIFTTFGGNAHAIVSISPPPPPQPRFDFILPQHTALPLQPGAKIVPYTQIKAMLKQRMARGTFVQLFTLKAHYPDLPFYVIDSPPIVPSIEYIRKHSTAFQEQIEKYGISPAHFRLKFWLLHSELLQEACAEHTIGFCPVSPAAKDEEGFLREALWHTDAAHGNAAYGTLVLHQVNELLGVSA